MSTRYIVHNEEGTLEVTVVEEGEGYRVELEGDSVYVDFRAIGGGPNRSLLIDGHSYETATMPTPNGVDVYVSGDVFHVKVTDELWARAEEAAHGGGAGHEEIVSPMPGAVVQIPVSEGQVIAAGETVAVVEAMKMQNEIAAVHGGRVRELRVSPGDVVDQGTVLVVLGPEEETSDD